jgi:hypothetical protein
MKIIVRISLFSLWAALIGFWPGDAGAQIGAPYPCVFPLAENPLGMAPGGAAARAAMMIKRTKCLQATGQLPAAGAAAAGGGFVTVDPPGSTSSSPSAITPDGTIAGYYSDADGVQHGFLRSPSGSFTTFDPPGSALTYVTSITPSGDIVGVYCETANCARGQIHGFVRAKQGSFTTFDAPGSGSVLGPIYSSLPPSINPAGAIAGTYRDASGNEHGFLRANSGALTTIDVPGASTEVLAINPSGVIVGDFCDQTTCFTGFIRFRNGSITTIDTPGSLACGGASIPTGGINPAGAVAGATSDPTCSVGLGFLRTPDGTITTFSPAAGQNVFFVQPTAINPAGSITGYFGIPNGAFLRTPDGAITMINVSASLTFPSAINPAGAIVGIYYDANGVQHGFLRLP